MKAPDRQNPAKPRYSSLSPSDRRVRLNAIHVERSVTKQAVDTMDQLRRDHREGAETKCMLLMGLPGVGKSHLLRRYRDVSQVPPVTTATSTLRPKPVVYVQLLSKATVNATADKILKELMGMVITSRSQSKEDMVATQLKIHGVELLILDDFQHASELGRAKTQSQTADFIKSITKDTMVPVVLAGMPSIYDLVEGNDQLKSICPFMFELDPFEYVTNVDMADFARFLDDLDELLPFDRPSKLSDPRTATSIFQATGGLLRHIRNLVGQAGYIAIDENSPSIRASDFRRAFDKAVYEPSCAENPFTGLVAR